MDYMQVPSLSCPVIIIKEAMCRLFLLAVLGVGLLTTCGSSGDEKKLAAGKEVYIAHCSQCHQSEGLGYAQACSEAASNPAITVDGTLG